MPAYGKITKLYSKVGALRERAASVAAAGGHKGRVSHQQHRLEKAEDKYKKKAGSTYDESTANKDKYATKAASRTGDKVLRTV